jgi:hypothetical protein
MSVRAVMSANVATGEIDDVPEDGGEDPPAARKREGCEALPLSVDGTYLALVVFDS